MATRPTLEGGQPPLPHDLSPKQFQVLKAICDTFLPSLPNEPQPEGEASGEDVKTFFELSASQAGVPEHAAGLLANHLTSSKYAEIKLILSLLTWRFGTFLLCGFTSLTWHFPFARSFAELEQEEREEVLQKWCDSKLLTFRTLFKAFKCFCVPPYFSKSDKSGWNPVWPALGYCGPDPQHNNKISSPKPLEKAVTDLRLESQKYEEEGLTGVLERAGCKVIDSSSKTSGPIIECDVVIVGSGSGGGVVAGVLAQAGYRVVVVEKGGYYAREDLTLLEGPSLGTLFERGGLLVSSDAGVGVLSGTAVGGGSAVNWAASFKTPPHVLREWTQDLGLKRFGSQEYRTAMEAVCQRGQVHSEGTEHSLQNQVLIKGCEALGWPLGPILRNAPGAHSCGWCTMGCKDGNKQGVNETWLVDAAKSGAIILAGCTCESVLIRNSVNGPKNYEAAGVLVKCNIGGKEEKFEIRARVTVVAAGSIHTPAILLRSEIKNINIGRHLHIHPVTLVHGYFPPGGALQGKGYEGGIMTAFSNIAGNWDSTGYGALLQTPTVHPGTFSILMPWRNSSAFRESLLRYSRTVMFIVLTRDKGEGAIRINKKGAPVLEYWPSKGDQESLLKGAECGIKVLIAAGAQEVGSLNGPDLNFKPKEIGNIDSKFEEFVGRIREAGFNKNSAVCMSAHQMGSCRMGKDKANAVVDEDCESWDVRGLFLGDASVFPTATGVNPMITVQSIAYCTSQAIRQRLDNHEF